jgi:prophage antirepressor-like protein
VCFDGSQNITIRRSGDGFLFSGRDVGSALGYGDDGKRFVDKVTSSWGLSEEIHFQRQGTDPVPSGGRAPVWLTEPGLYRALMRSRAPKAEAFQEWLATEVLPALRRDGRYSVAGATAPSVAAQLRALVADLRAETDPLLRMLLIRAAEEETGENIRGLVSVSQPPPPLPAAPRAQPRGQRPLPAAPPTPSPKASPTPPASELPALTDSKRETNRRVDLMMAARDACGDQLDLLERMVPAIMAPRDPRTRARAAAVATRVFEVDDDELAVLEAVVLRVPQTPMPATLRHLARAAVAASRLPSDRASALVAQVEVLVKGFAPAVG